MRNLKMVFCLDPYKGGVVAAGSDGQFRQRETVPGGAAVPGSTSRQPGPALSDINCDII